MAARCQGQTHESVVRLKHSVKCGKVGRRARQGLDVDAPQSRIQAIGIKRSLNAQVLIQIDELVSTIVSGTRVSFSVLVGQDRSVGFEYRGRRKVFARNKLKATALTDLFLLDNPPEL